MNRCKINRNQNELLIYRHTDGIFQLVFHLNNFI